jgi:hypothetical protein
MIAKEMVLGIRSEPGTHRKQFSANSGVQKNKPKPTFSVPFDNGLCRHFADGTGLNLRWNGRFGQYYCFLEDEEAIKKVEAWEKAQGTRVFIKNLMSSSLALDLNFSDNVSGHKTRIGLLEERAKHYHDEAAVAELVHLSVETVESISWLRDCDALMAVPAMPDKTFDLPRELAKGIQLGTGKDDVTPWLVLDGKTQSAKAVELSHKWDVWAQCSAAYVGPNLTGRRVLLLDDKYQSGITIQYWASKLLELGAAEVHGLSMVKTLRDTDNV